MNDSLRVMLTPAPVRQQAVRNLRTVLAGGRFQPGDRLTERMLCDILGTSRTTIREALRQLEAEGLVEVVAGKGPVVATVTEEDVRDLYDVREVLETLAVKWFVERAPESAYEELERAFESALLAAHERRNAADILAALQDYYRVLFEGTRNTVLSDVEERLLVRITRVRLVAMSQPDRMLENIQEQKVVLEAIRERDAEAAQAAHSLHVRNAAAAALEAVRAINEGRSGTEDERS